MPGLKRTTTCRGCGKQIAFIKTISGKSIPVDPIPKRFIPEEENEKYINEEGEVKHGRGLDWRGWTTKQTEAGYTDHRTTCPAADQFRKKNKSERVKSEE